MGTAMVLEKPAPFVSAFVDAVDEAIRAQSPSHGMSAMQRTWLAFCVTAVRVTNSICWARFERASLGTYALAALSWMFRHSKMPWDQLLVASVRVLFGTMASPGAPWSSTIPTTRAQNRPRHWPISIHCAIKKVGA